jgi:hypothetical protein
VIRTFAIGFAIAFVLLMFDVGYWLIVLACIVWGFIDGALSE